MKNSNADLWNFVMASESQMNGQWKPYEPEKLFIGDGDVGCHDSVKVIIYHVYSW